MKVTVTKKVEMNIKHILIDIAPRYIGDSEDDDMPTDMPMLTGDQWRAKVDVDTGKIEGWPADGGEREFYVKVCDAGLYTLYDDESNVVATKDGYVPNDIVPGEYGDYVHLKIAADGTITNWPSSPCVGEFFESEY